MFGSTINNNPSVGNKKGGLTTIYEKSLGAIAKGGTTALREVYNFAEIRQELEALGYRFRSRSDSEVVVNGWQAWGPIIFSRLRGMFALAIWDRRSRRLILARDRLGKKPLYYAPTARAFLFGLPGPFSGKDAARGSAGPARLAGPTRTLPAHRHQHLRLALARQRRRQVALQLLPRHAQHLAALVAADRQLPPQPANPVQRPHIAAMVERLSQERHRPERL